MAVELRVAGPGLDVSRTLEPGEPAVILGRDTDCSICLPDPERNVSRRHLSVWNEGDRLHFHVLSVVNGVESAAGELPPGARGVLSPGDSLGLSAYRVSVEAAAAAPAAAGSAGDPWAEFERQAAELVPDGAGPDTLPYAAAPEDDPFGDWGFHSTFGPGAPSGGLQADALAQAADLQPFFAGLGLDPSAQRALTNGELETIGRVTRIALQGLLQAVQAAAAGRQELRAEDRTMAEPREMNPLRLDTPLETKLYYLFGGQAAGAGFVPPDRAVAQMVTELAAHQQAVGDAVRETVEAVVREFDPEALKKRLLGGGARIFESARAWDAFVRDYAERASASPPWVQQLLERNFALAYARALLRAKRNTPNRPKP
jgi:predicted component of type VI protein secretion system